jgi:hypothetical protein
VILAAAATLALAGPAMAAPAFVATVSTRAVTDDASNTLALTVGAAGVAAGDTVIVVAGKGKEQQAVASVTDSRGNAYTIDQSVHGPTGSGIGIGVASARISAALVAGDAITVTYEGTTAYTNRFAAAYEFSGISTADASATTGGYGVQPLTGSATTTQDGELGFALFDIQSLSPAFLPGPGYQALAAVTGGVVGQTLQPAFTVLGTAGAQQATATLGGLASWQGVLVTYRAGAAPPPTPPANTALPTISGSARSGSTLTASPGSWSGTVPFSYAYGWQRCAAGGGSCVSVGSGPTYAALDADVGSTLSVVVTATNAAGSTAATSAATATVAAAPPPASVGFVGTVAAAQVTDGDTNTLALTVGAAGVAAGDTVVVTAAKARDHEAIASVADSRGNVYAVDGKFYGGTGSTMGMGVASSRLSTALLPGDTITVTFEGAAAYTNRFGAAYEFAGLNGADSTGAAAGYGTQLASGTATTTQDGTLLFGVFLVQSTAPGFLPGSGLQALAPAAGGVVGQTLQPEWALGAAAGAQQATGTLGSLASWQGALVAYRTVSGAPAVPPSNTALPTISGTPRDGQILTAGTGTWTGSPPISYAYRWQRCPAGSGCVDVGSAATYALVPADVGAALRVFVTATNIGGSATAASAPVTVLAAPPVNTAPPAVSGTPHTGSTFSASTGTWTGTPPIAFAFAWQRCDAGGGACVATGITDSTYMLGMADLGSTLRAVVTGTNSAGSVSATSAPSPVVVDAGTPTGPRFVKDLGSTSLTNSTDNQLVITVPAGGVAAGDTIVVVAAKGKDQEGIASVSDQRSNAYTVDANAHGSVGSGLGVGIASAFVATALNGGDRITITYQGAIAYTNRWGSAYEFAGLSSGGADVATTNGSYGTTLTTGATATTAQASELVLGVFDVQATGTGFAPGAGYQALTQAPAGGIGHTLLPEFAIVSARGAQQATATFPSAVSYVGAAAAYRAAAGPASTSPPTISGSAVQGQTLTTTTGSWTGAAPISYAYQWQRCDASGSACASLPGANDSTYVVGTADVGGTLRVLVTASNASGSSSVPSTATPVVTGSASSTPPVTTGMQLWFEADTEATADGQPLTLWHDKSGNGRDLTAAAAAAPVVHRAGLNGRATVEFDGLSSMMKTYGSTFTIGQPSTFFIVYRSLDPNTAVRAFVFDSRNSTLRQTFGRPALAQIRLYANADLDFAGITYPFPAFQVWTGTFNGVSSAVWRNGALVGSGNAGGSVMSGFAVGGLSTTGTGAYDLGHSQIAEIVYYAGALSAADRQAVINWLNLKYGLF